MNGDQSADLVCVQADGSVDIYQTHTSDTGINFAPQPYVDSLFGFCPADQDEKARVANHIASEIKLVEVRIVQYGAIEKVQKSSSNVESLFLTDLLRHL